MTIKWMLFFCNCLIPVIMVLAGYYMKNHVPKDINYIFGYRTPRSMKNLDTWKTAHTICGSLWMKLGMGIFIPSVLVQILFLNIDGDMFSYMSLLLEGIQIVVLIGSIFIVERQLKNTFDENGNRKLG